MLQIDVSKAALDKVGGFRDSVMLKSGLRGSSQKSGILGSIGIATEPCRLS